MNDSNVLSRVQTVHKVAAKRATSLRRPVLLLWVLALALLITLCIQITPIHGDKPTFMVRQHFGTGSDGTWSVVVGDMDGDGHLDIVTNDYEGQNVVYLNDGSGHFDWPGSVRPFGTGSDRTYSVAIGDIDGDGDLDIIAGNYNEQNIVYLNDGDGDFYTGTVDNCDSPSGNARCFGSDRDPTLSVAMGDMDGDGDLDIIAGNNDEQDIIYLNDGGGDFYTDTVDDCSDPPESVRCFGTDSDPTLSVAVGYLNDDKHLDIVVGYDGSITGHKNTVYLNDGDGDFSDDDKREFGPGWDETWSVIVADMNGDNRLDLVTANDGTQNMVYLNDGDGDFPEGNKRDFGTGSDDTRSAAVGDVDSDGDLDIVIGNTGSEEPNAVYLNDGEGYFNWIGGSCHYGTGTENTFGVAAADMNSDGHLDLITANWHQQNVIYMNDGEGDFPEDNKRGFGTSSDNTHSVAVGDVNSDGYLDVISGNENQPNAVYLNSGAGPFDLSDSVINFGTGTDSTQSVAAGDINADGYLDLITGNDGQNIVYLNDGQSSFYTDTVACGSEPQARCFGTGSEDTTSVALGDVDNDGDLDIVSGNDGEQNVVYLNDGNGGFHTGPAACGSEPDIRCFGIELDDTKSIAVGDLDGDGDLDLVAGNDGGQNAVFLNDGTGHFGWSGSARDFGTRGQGTWSVALGDLDGDGDLDIVTGNYNQQNVVFLNDGAGHFDWPSSNRNFGTGEDNTSGVAVKDIDGDGDLDIVTGNDGGQDVVYLNDGTGYFSAGSARDLDVGPTSSVALGDMDGDGDIDIVTGSAGDQNMVYLNHLVGTDLLASNPPAVAIARPGPTANADFLSTPLIHEGRSIPISYTLFDPDSDPVGRITAYYSLDGGGSWYTATATTDTTTTNLATGPYWTPTLTNSYVFTWDTFSSGVFGQSDNVVFRLETYPQPIHSNITKTYRYSGTTSGPYQRPYASATTFPFRVRGTQVRVLSSTTPVSNALVYRLPKGQYSGGSLLANNAGQPFHTDQRGFLQGRGTIAISDTLVALLPITATESFNLYFTNATPTRTGVEAYTVTAPGVQTLTVSSANPLILFNLDVSLEWDARKDTQFTSQLAFDLQRASELLYDWTNGQAALGHVNVYHNREKWQDTHVRIYASNRMRPNAAIGGIVSRVLTDPSTSSLIYAPGQLRMGAVWNRYGDANGSLGEDWPRALAHELGHYAFFLDDNYLGLDTNGLLVPVETCPGAMSDPYRDDEDSGYGEFHQEDGWVEECGDTLAAQSTGRWDWQTITTFFPWLIGDITNTGPNGLPLAVTEITFVEPASPSLALDVPIFYLTQDSSRVQPGASARAFLFQEDRLVDLGRPTLDQVLARGARPDDRLCVYELAAKRLGCETISPGDNQLELTEAPDWWEPEVIVSPITSRTIALSVTGLPTERSLNARLFPVNSPAPLPISLSPASGGVFAGTFSLDEPALEGYVLIWDQDEPDYQIVTEYLLGGSPAHLLGRFAHLLGRFAPAISADGQVILFGFDLDYEEEWFYTLQAATTIPDVPPWATVVGHGYWLSASPNAPDLSNEDPTYRTTSISFQYLGNEVPPGEEDWLRVYYWDGNTWEQLPTQLNTYHNLASAPTQGVGVYALMSSLEIPLYQQGWNLFAYPVPGTRPVREALLSIEGFYSTVYGYEATDSADPWKVFDVSAPDWVNDLKQLRFGSGYWINITEPITLQLKGNSTTSIASVHSFPSPPATYYGSVQPDAGFEPTAGMTVNTWINGKLCAQTQTQEINGQIVYAIDVPADGGGSAAGCGASGRSVNFKVGSQLMATTAYWDNNQVWEWPLRRIQTYFPLIVHGPFP